MLKIHYIAQIDSKVYVNVKAITHNESAAKIL